MIVDVRLILGDGGPPMRRRLKFDSVPSPGGTLLFMFCDKEVEFDIPYETWWHLPTEEEDADVVIYPLIHGEIMRKDDGEGGIVDWSGEELFALRKALGRAGWQIEGYGEGQAGDA